MSDFISDDEEAYGRGSESLETYDYADFMCNEDEELSEDFSYDEASVGADLSATDESDITDIIDAPFPYTAERKKRVVFIDDYIYY